MPQTLPGQFFLPLFQIRERWIAMGRSSFQPNRSTDDASCFGVINEWIRHQEVSPRPFMNIYEIPLVVNVVSIEGYKIMAPRLAD